MAQTRLKSGNLHMIGGDNGSSGNVLKSKGDGTMEWGVIIINPTFSSFDYPGNDTALDPAGNQSLVINGTGFNLSVTVTIGGTTCSSITRNSSEQLTVTTPAKSAGSQALVITNTDGGSASTNVSYNGVPAFTNAAGSLASVTSGATINVSAVATEPDGGAITYAITSGSLPSGISLNTSTGAITGTAPSVSASTTSNFTVTATDNENQSTARAYSITVAPPLPSDNFAVVTYTGNGGTKAVTGVGFKPDLVWVKKRSGSDDNAWFDSSRGVQKEILSNSNAAEATKSAAISSFDNDGFTTGANGALNANNATYVAWCFKANGGTTSSNTDGDITSTVQANNDLGFSIAKWTSTSTSSHTIGHGLSGKPDAVLYKKLSGTGNWFLYTDIIDGSWDELVLSGNNAKYDYSATYATSTTFRTVSSSAGADWITYSFKSVEKFSKIDKYTGNGSTNGPIVETGFEPAFLMIKKTNGTDNWYIVDNKRSTSNPRQAALFANSTDAEWPTYTAKVDFLSNGFQIVSTDGSTNGNNDTYLYMAFAADPDTTAPTLADSFNIETYTGTGSAKTISGLGFSPNLVVLKHRNNGTAHQWNWLDTVRTNGHTIHSNSDAASEAGTNMISSYTSDGFILGTDNAVSQSGINHVAWAWKADDNEETIEEVTEDADSIAIYKFEDDVDDVTGNYNGAATNITYATGKFNKAAEFNGSSSYIAIGSLNTFLASDSNKSWSAWFKTSRSSGSNMGIVSDYGANGNYNFDTYLIPGTGKVQLVTNRGGSSQNSLTSGAYNDGNWHHAAVTQNMSTGKTKLYIDSVLQFTLDSGTGSGQDGPLYIGSYTAGTGKYNWDGLIDQVRIYNKELNAASIINLYNETTAQNDTLNIGTKATVSEQSIVSANANAGMSIVKYKGNGVVGAKIPHGLSASPDFILTKNLEESRDWRVFHSDLSTNQFLALNTSGAVGTAPANTCCGAVASVSATTFGFVAGNGGATELDNVNKSGINYVSYCFHDVAAYQKFGSFTGTGTGTNQLINTGFQPDWVMFKDYSAGGSWWIQDSVRGSSLSLKANSTNTESTTNYVTFESNGFRVSGDANGTSSWIYWAIKIN